LNTSPYNRYNARRARTRRPAWQRQGKILYLTVIIFLFFYTTIGPYGFWRLHKMKSYRQELYNKTKEATILNTELRNKLVAIKSDKTFQEKLVRSKLGWIRDGEILYKFSSQHKN